MANVQPLVDRLNALAQDTTRWANRIREPEPIRVLIRVGYVYTVARMARAYARWLNYRGHPLEAVAVATAVVALFVSAARLMAREALERGRRLDDQGNLTEVE